MKTSTKRAALTLLAALMSAARGPAQEHRPTQDVTVPRWHFGQEFRMPDSLARAWVSEPHWNDDFTEEEALWELRQAVPMSSVIVVLREHLPVATMVLPNHTLRIGHHLVLSNGQADGWAPWPAGYLDARTLSLPLP